MRLLLVQPLLLLITELTFASASLTGVIDTVWSLPSKYIKSIVLDQSVGEDLAFLVGTRRTIMRIWENGTYQTLFQMESDELIDGIGQHVQLGDVISMESISRDEILIADTASYCIRLLDMSSLEFSTYVGQCESYQGIFNGHRLTEAKLHYPKNLQKVDCNVFFIISKQINFLNLATDIVEMAFELDFSPYTFLIDVNQLLIYVTHPNNQIDVLNLRKSTIGKLIGTTSGESNMEAVGTFDETRFDRPRGLTKLADDLILVSDQSGNRIVVLNMTTNESTAIGMGDQDDVGTQLPLIMMTNSVATLVKNGKIYAVSGIYKVYGITVNCSDYHWLEWEECSRNADNRCVRVRKRYICNTEVEEDNCSDHDCQDVIASSGGGKNATYVPNTHRSAMIIPPLEGFFAPQISICGHMCLESDSICDGYIYDPQTKLCWLSGPQGKIQMDLSNKISFVKLNVIKESELDEYLGSELITID